MAALLHSSMVIAPPPAASLLHKRQQLPDDIASDAAAGLPMPKRWRPGVPNNDGDFLLLDHLGAGSDEREDILEEEEDATVAAQPPASRPPTPSSSPAASASPCSRARAPLPARRHRTEGCQLAFPCTTHLAVGRRRHDAGSASRGVAHPHPGGRALLFVVEFEGMESAVGRLWPPALPRGDLEPQAHPAARCRRSSASRRRREAPCVGAFFGASGTPSAQPERSITFSFHSPVAVAH